MKARSIARTVLLAVFAAACVAAMFGDRSPLLATWSCVFLIGRVVASLLRARRARARARDHEAAESDAKLAPLREGPCVLEGEVQYAQGAREAMRAEFVQVGSEAESSGSWSHKWTETHRKLTVQPFYLLRRDGERIRVEPIAEQSRLYDELENKILVREPLAGAGSAGAPQRARFATLVPNERVWVTGRLERGFDPEESRQGAGADYRHNARPSSWLVRGNPALLVSSVSLAEHFRGRARRHTQHGILYFAFLSLPLLMLERYADRAFGSSVVGTVETVREVHDDDNRVTGYRATVRHALGRSESERLEIRPQLGTTMEFRVGLHCDNPGSSARFTAGEQMLCFLIGAGLLVLQCTLRLNSIRSLPWYRSEHIKVEDSGSGRLQV